MFGIDLDELSHYWFGGILVSMAITIFTLLIYMLIREGLVIYGLGIIVIPIIVGRILFPLKKNRKA